MQIQFLLFVMSQLDQLIFYDCQTKEIKFEEMREICIYINSHTINITS